MKLQCSIQSSHTQIAQSQVTYLTSRNEHVWLLTKVFTSIEGFSFGFHFSYFMINTTQFLSNDAVKFFIFLWGISLWLWDHTFWIRFAPPFPSQISFWNKTFSTLSLSRDWCLKSLFFNIKINVRRYIGSSLRMHQDQSRLLARHSWQAWRFIYNNQT